MELNPQKQSQAAALAIVLRVGRDLVPQVYQSISCSSGKATCWVSPGPTLLVASAAQHMEGQCGPQEVLQVQSGACPAGV